MVKKIYKLDTANGAVEFGDAVVQSQGSADAGDVVGLNEHGRLDPSVMPDGIGARVRTLEAKGALAANDLVNTYYDEEDEAWRVRRASAGSSATFCNGFVKEACSDGELAAVYLDGTFDVDSAIVETLNNTTLYLSAVTPGKPAAYSASAAILQIVGYLVDDEVAEFQPAPAIVQTSR